MIMAFKKIMTTVTEKVSLWCHAICGIKKDATQNSIMLIIGFAVGLILLGGFYGYRWYRTNQEEIAQRVFSQSVQEYERVLKEGKAQDWASVETLFKIGYSQYSHAALAPFFLVYQAQAMIKQDKTVQAHELLSQAVNAMSPSSVLYPLFKIKLALMTMETNAQEAVAQLQLLADDTSSHFSDAAAYYLGEYYWIHNDHLHAKEAWQKMIDATKTDKKLGQSPWALLAQEKLAQLA